MDLSIVIPSYNTNVLLEECLRSIYTTCDGKAFSFEIIVVDNNSRDGSTQMVKKKYRRVVLLANNKNLGYGKANNQGIQTAKGKYILLLNSDTVVQKDAIHSLLEFTKTQKDAFVGAKLYNADGSVQTSCGSFFTPWVVFAALFLKGDVIGLTRWSPTRTRTVDWVSGACIMAKKELFLNDLLFDEGIFMYMEEIDLLFRAKEKGYKTIFYPDSHVTHLGCGGSMENRKKAIVNIYRGITYFYRKHYPKNSYTIVQLMLRVKAWLGICIGTIIGNSEMKKTYEEAIQLV